MSLNENGLRFVNYFKNIITNPKAVIVERIDPKKVGGDWELGYEQAKMK